MSDTQKSTTSTPPATGADPMAVCAHLVSWYDVKRGRREITLAEIVAQARAALDLDGEESDASKFARIRAISESMTGHDAAREITDLCTAELLP